MVNKFKKEIFMDGISEHNSGKCFDCGHLPGERPNGDDPYCKDYSEGETDEGGCDQIANPFLTNKSQSPYGIPTPNYKKSSEQPCGFGVSENCGTVNNSAYTQKSDLSAWKNWSIRDKADSAKDCTSEYKTFPYKTKNVHSEQSYYAYGEDEMTSEAKRWMGKYSQLKKNQDLQIEWMVSYIDEITRKMQDNFEKTTMELMEVVYEKVAELEKKIDSKIE
jgi:hypothetical protein